MFKALLLEKDEAGFRAGVRPVDEAAPARGRRAGAAIEHSTLNYKDGLAITNRSPVVRTWPMVAGIDGAGTVLESQPRRLEAGRPLRAQRLGRGRDALGLPRRARQPEGRLAGAAAGRRSRTRQAMAIGTAGYTAMLCVLALERHGVRAGDGEVLVTGASGGVGSVAIALLARLGHRVVASTGKADRGRLPAAARRRRGRSTGPSSPRPASRCRRSAGARRSTRSAARRWSTRWRRRATAAWSPPAAWPRATTCRAR